jgi:hypothetical protein
MDEESEPHREVTRVPTDADLVSLARELHRLGVAYVVVGGFAINRLGFVRATEDIDLLIARDRANQALVKKALEILPDRAIRELGDEDIARWVVVRVNDDITVDLMTEACGVRYEDAVGGIEIETIDGVPIPFASADLMLKMKQSTREKDVGGPELPATTHPSAPLHVTKFRPYRRLQAATPRFRSTWSAYRSCRARSTSRTTAGRSSFQ